MYVCIYTLCVCSFRTHWVQLQITWKTGKQFSQCLVYNRNSGYISWSPTVSWVLLCMYSCKFCGINRNKWHLRDYVHMWVGGANSVTCACYFVAAIGAVPMPATAIVGAAETVANAQCWKTWHEFHGSLFPKCLSVFLACVCIFCIEVVCHF